MMQRRRLPLSHCLTSLPSLSQPRRLGHKAHPPAASVMRMSCSCGSTGSGWLVAAMPAPGSPVIHRKIAVCIWAREGGHREKSDSRSHDVQQTTGA